MKLPHLLLLACAAFAGPVSVSSDKGTPPRRPGKCDPYATHCLACHDCTQCGHCAGKGGFCSVCLRR
jgi:hypothetical protein